MKDEVPLGLILIRFSDSLLEPVLYQSIVRIQRAKLEMERNGEHEGRVKERTANQGLKEVLAGLVHHKKAAAVLITAKGMTLILILMVAMARRPLKREVISKAIFSNHLDLIPI